MPWECQLGRQRQANQEWHPGNRLGSSIMRNKCICMYICICIYLYMRIGGFLFIVSFFFGDAQHFLRSDNTGPKRLLQSPAPLALFPPLPPRLLQHISTQLLTCTSQYLPTALCHSPALNPAGAWICFDNTVSRLFPHNKCESPAERKELSRKRLQRPFLHTIVPRKSHLAFAPSFSSIIVHVDIKKIRKTILSITYVACLNLNRNRRSW